MPQQEEKTTITVIKQNYQGKEQIRYTGVLLDRNTDCIVIQANWIQPSRNLGYTQFETGDVFIEYFYSQRWFNIFAIASPKGYHKGWYCNITEPTIFENNTITHRDLLLDVWVDPSGNVLVLDQQEFSVALLSKAQRTGALQGLDSLLALIGQRKEMFAQLLQMNNPTHHDDSKTT